MINQPFHVATVTAFNEDESLDVIKMIQHVKHLMNQGVQSVLLCGSTGEQHSLTLDEKLMLLKAFDEEVELMNQVQVIFGVASIREHEALVLAKAISESKVAGILLGYPPYILPTQQEALTYSRRVIECANKPTILYNNPGRTGFDLAVDSIVELSKMELVVGIKEAGDVHKVFELKGRILRSDFYYYSGGEVGLEDKLKLGYNRLSSILGNIAPKQVESWFEQLSIGGSVSEKDQQEIHQLREMIYRGSAIVNIKKYLNENGVSVGICRDPLGNSELK